MPTRKIPLRRCTGWGEMKSKKELIRVVHNKEGEVSLDRTGKKAGRGAYICPNPDCLQKARKSRGLERALSCRIPEEIYDHMEEELGEP